LSSHAFRNNRETHECEITRRRRCGQTNEGISVTPPGGNQGAAGSFVPGWAPDLRRSENRLNMAILVKF